MVAERTNLAFLPKRRIRSPLERRVCSYCLGRHGSKRPRRWCSDACRKCASAARRPEVAGLVTPICLRRTTTNAERRSATGFGTLTATEAYMADLRVRCIDLLEVDSQAQLEAAVQLLGSVEAVALHIGVEPHTLAHWGVDEAAAVRSVAWSWRDDLPASPTDPMEAQ